MSTRMIILAFMALMLAGCEQPRSDPLLTESARRRDEATKSNLQKQLDMGYKEHKKHNFKDVHPGARPGTYHGTSPEGDKAPASSGKPPHG